MSGLAVPISQALLNAVFVVTLVLRPRIRLVARAYPAILICLSIVAVAAHFNFFRYHQPGQTHVHYLDFYHYYIGTKYFREIGYDGLYEATVIADIQDDPEGYSPQLQVRSLADDSFETQDQIARRARSIEARFSHERWAEFKRDIAIFRGKEPVLWRSAIPEVDHGYNGPPLVTMILGTLANQSWVSPVTFIRVTAWLDPALIVIAASLAAAWLGWEVGLLFVFLWTANPFTDYSFVGGSYLRFMYLVALFLGSVALAQGRGALAGAAFAFAALARIYPGLFVAGVLSLGILSFRRHEPSKPRGSWRGSPLPRFAAGFALTAILLVGLTSLQPTPHGENPWVSLGRRLWTHEEKPYPNVVGLRSLFYYSDAYNSAEILRSWDDGRRLNWIVQAEQTFRRHKPYYYATTAVAFLALAWLLRRGRPVDGVFVGIVAAFVWLYLSHYDYAFLCIVPFLFMGRRDALALTSGLYMLVAASQLLPKAQEVMDFKFMLASALIGSWALAMWVVRMLAQRQTTALATGPRGVDRTPSRTRRRPGRSRPVR